MSPEKKKEKSELTFSTENPELGILGPLEALFGKFEELELEDMTIEVDELEVIVPPGVGSGMSDQARQFLAQNAFAVQQFAQQMLAIRKTTVLKAFGGKYTTRRSVSTADSAFLIVRLKRA